MSARDILIECVIRMVLTCREFPFTVAQISARKAQTLGMLRACGCNKGSASLGRREKDHMADQKQPGVH